MTSVIRRTGFWMLLVVVLLFCREASAVLVSSYHDGSAFYNVDGLYGRVDFAVYDTDPELESEYYAYKDEYLDNSIEKPGEGRYIYAYQIFNDHFFSEQAVSYFGLRDDQGDFLEESLMNGTSAQDDDTDGIAPSPLISETQGEWIWTLDGNGYISKDEHSWLLVFSSDHDWVRGTFEIRGPETEEVPVPEPATVLVLGLGSIPVLARAGDILSP